ncbi:DNA repair protein RecN [Lactobacillus acetotolerans]|jgi:DNA repair protein RecN (Recombination protein N)|uniref:DNA repair protein RecN n=1 Tax=Lactobacillus acetotolerans TaxID=1600 RepID=UPI0007BA1860|nr:DNA repair protein RecN [Lactobacillus acetotolerans]MBN7275934.1 DNA repair protein RecN [Lactobacillus acetotolerans]QGV04796.1 DNA repair protein RecN [Lactobacillus acetotolerans]QJD73696.1 DNA repair protein RecN [Lactobacillus acetotolerans]HBG90888.1 DNA repair protein RecN [Lactobacillus acetotolerans]HCX39963.1 DNA repair protein RecN [Lactobacillus acetotolerans]
MLVELDIKNFAIIKALKVRFQEHMTVLIGETGAGKSIIIDAVSLLMGGRGQKEMIRTGEKKAVVTGLFQLDGQEKKITELCDKYGLPHSDDQLVISRELAAKGRNVVRINGQLTTINVLRDIGNYLVDIHGQNDQQILMDQDRQIDLVDNYAPKSFKDNLAKYQKDFLNWQKLTNRLRHLREDAQELAQKQDILKFQDNELKAADLKDPKEDEKLENEYNELNNYQKIVDTANYFMQLYDDDEHGIATLLGDAQNAAADLTEYGSKFKDIAKTVDDGVYALSDARSELSNVMDEMDFDEERFKYVSNRLDTLNSLKKKYGPTLKDVFAFYEKVQKELSQYETGGLDEEKLQNQVAELNEKLTKEARGLHRTREKVAHKLVEKIKQELADLYMAKARFSINFDETKTFTKKGTDSIVFLIAPNPGENLMPLVKIVSGGEQSRLILALKAIFSRVEPVGTMIFDEIDTGVSGRVSAAIGEKLHSIGENKQVIAITHSPQVAAAGDQRYLVAKQIKDGATFAQIGPLTQKETITAIAQMMAGNDVTEAAKQNAADLMKSFKNKKDD